MQSIWLKKTVLAAIIALMIGFSPSCDSDEDSEPEIGDRMRVSADLIAFDSCEELKTTLKENLNEEMRVYLLSLQDVRYLDVPGGQVEADAPSDVGGRQEGVDYSGTNNQEAGVDEADFVKTDGYYIYVLNSDQLMILGVPEFGMLVEGASVQIEGYPNQMLLSKEISGGKAIRVVVFSTIYTNDILERHPMAEFIKNGSDDHGYYPSTILTKLTMIDLTGPDAPLVIRELYLEGSYQTARKVKSSIHMVAYSWMDVAGLRYWPELPDEYYRLDPEDPRRDQIWNEAIEEAIQYNDELIAQLTLENLVPMIYEVSNDGEVIEYDFTQQGCTNFIIAEDGVSRGFTSIFSLDLLSEKFSFEADHIVSNWSIIYASTDTLLIAEPAQDWWWYWDNDEYQEATNIHRFSIHSPGKAEYRGSGRVDGTVHNQFSLSEYKDFIRVATTTGQWNRWWIENPPALENHVYVLAGNDRLTVVGQIDGIAVGEQIWAARFIEERGYLVTFRNIDPLWTIDLSDPTNPTIMGELEVPGVSTYIHPLGDVHLLTIGLGGDDQGLDGSIKVSLFDVTDFNEPVITDNLTLTATEGEGWTSWGSSEATYEHKAFQYWNAKKMLAVPLSTNRYIYSGYGYVYEYISRLMLISVDIANGFSIYGNVDHSIFYNSDPSNYWCYQDIRRSIFMGDYLYAISDRGITANNLDNMTLTASVALPGITCGPYWDEVQ